MKKAVIYPGRFQPMLPHHAEVYRRLQSSFPDADVYVATSNKVEEPKSPFTFDEKTHIIEQMHGIPKDKILIAPQPYLVDSFKDKFDTENTMVIFAVGEKDNDRFPMKNVDPDTGLDMTVRGEARPKYYQMINTLKQHPPMPMSERGYIYNAPSIEGLDGEVASASAFRKAFTSVENEQQQRAIFEKYMGTFNENIFALFKNKIIGDKMKESLERLKFLAGMTESAPVDFDEPEVDDEEGLKPGFAQKNMMTQLGKIADSDAASQDADVMKVKNFSKITTVTTDDGDDVELSGAEAKAMIEMFNMLSSQRAGDEQSPRERFIRAIQTTKGLENMIAFAKSKGLVEEAVEQPVVDFGDIRSDYGVNEEEELDEGRFKDWDPELLDAVKKGYPHPIEELYNTLISIKSNAKLAKKYVAMKDPEEAEYLESQGVFDFGKESHPLYVWADKNDPEPELDGETDKAQEAVEEAACSCCGNDPCDCGPDCPHCGGKPDLDEVAGPKDCWDGYKKDGTQPGTGKNKGKRVNKCVKEETVDNAMTSALAELRRLAGM
jgi:hypothetical protein